MSSIGAGWIWIGALLAYAGFSLWYNNLSGPLSPAAIDSYLERLAAAPDPKPEQLAGLRAFLEADDGREFFMLNLVRLHDGPVVPPGGDAPQPAAAVLEGYTGPFLRALFARAGHLALGGRAAAGYLDQWGVEANPGWSFAGVVRYRSRRDLAELASDPAFAPAHAFKIAAMSNTLAFPLAPGMLFFGPRVWVPLALALLAALAHLALRILRA